MEILIGALLAVAGVGVAAYFWSHPRHPRVVVELTEVAFIAPHLMGLDVGLQLGNRNLRNLYLLELSVANRTSSDAVDANAATPATIGKRPRIDLPPDFKVPQVPWLHSAFEAAGDVRVTANLRDVNGKRVQSVAVHIHHLARKTTVVHRLIATCETERPTNGFSLTGGEVSFFPGAIKDIHVVGAGLLADPPPALKN